jgi:hypothetical protein
MDDEITVRLGNQYVLEALQEEADHRGITAPELIRIIVGDWYDNLFLENDLQAFERAKREPGAAVPWRQVREHFPRGKRLFASLCIGSFFSQPLSASSRNC